MKTGLVLEGGAMRGMYTAGILDTLMQEGISFDGIVGVSAGALFGVNFLSRQVGRVLRYNQRFNGDKNYMGWRPLLREGNIISTKYAYETVPRELDVFDDATYRASKVPFYAVVTRLDSGEAEYIPVKSVFEQMDVLRASGSMPFVSKPVMLDGKLYLDGAVADSIPFRFLQGQGYEKLVVVLTRDRNYRKKPMSKIPSKLLYRKYPHFAKRLIERHTMYHTALEELEGLEREGKAFLLRPTEPIEISRMEKDPKKLQKVYDLGIRDAKANMEALRAFLQK